MTNPTMTAQEIRDALDNGRVFIKIGRGFWLARPAGTGRIRDLGDGKWFVRVTGGPHPKKNGHGFISTEADDIPWFVTDAPVIAQAAGIKAEG